MVNSKSDKKIKILKNGPYEVMGGILLSKGEIAPDKNGVLGFKKTKDYKIETPENYHLCRCGKSKNKPFCDGSHVKEKFVGAEVASKEKYLNRADIQDGASLKLADDNRCAFARFCHRENGDVWTLAELSNNKENRREAIEGANACPAGRLSVFEKDGTPIEESTEAAIFVVEDPNNPRIPCSAGLFVSGKVPLESADGELYEERCKYTLCRCGRSKNVPFCDATHVPARFHDDEDDK